MLRELDRKYSFDVIRKDYLGHLDFPFVCGEDYMIITANEQCFVGML